MKAMILAGGKGTRISEESASKPKPMIEIGGMPILWHIMKIYEAHGINEFIIALGYKGYMIKNFFANYLLHRSNVTFKLKEGKRIYHKKRAEDWSVTLVDTGDETQVGGRIKKAARFLMKDEEFCLTYGDGVADINITEELAFHKKHGKLATIAAVQPPGRFGALEISKDGKVNKFMEKPHGDRGYINGGFFVLSREVLDYIDGDQTVWEREPLEKIAKEGQLAAYRHTGFWQPMDTLRDKNYLEQLWDSGNAPWKVW